MNQNTCVSRKKKKEFLPFWQATAGQEEQQMWQENAGHHAVKIMVDYKHHTLHYQHAAHDCHTSQWSERTGYVMTRWVSSECNVQEGENENLFNMTILILAFDIKCSMIISYFLNLTKSLLKS